MKSYSFQQSLTEYLARYLPGQLGVSSNTVMCYRDTFSLLLKYCRDERHIQPERMDFARLNRDLVEGFLQWVERSRHCSISTRNHRLAVIHAFSRYVMIEHPENSAACQGILTIQAKKKPAPSPNYMTVDAIRAILAGPSLRTKPGRRDLALLTLLYESGARVQEIIDVAVGDIRLSQPATLKLTGKGNKSRIVPIVSDAARIVNMYLSDGAKGNIPRQPRQPLFVNQKGEKLSRSGVSHIVKRYVEQARKLNSELFPDHVTPHVFRHSKAMHLLEANVNLIYIRDLLGHVSVQTTEVYARASPDAKRRALEKASVEVLPSSQYSKEEENELLTWLKDLV